MLLGRITLVLVIAAGVTGCRGLFQNDYRDRLSSVNSATAPDTVKVGSVFHVEIETSGSDGCWRQGEDAVARRGTALIDITPFDREYVGSGACTANIVTFLHSVPLSAPAQGTLVIRVLHRHRSTEGRDSVGVIQLSVQVNAN